MSAQHRFASNKEFWAGVAATVSVGILLAIAAPNLMRSRMSKQERYQTMTALAAITGAAACQNHANSESVARNRFVVHCPSARFHSAEVSR
jgi:hypothetical protein